MHFSPIHQYALNLLHTSPHSFLLVNFYLDRTPDQHTAAVIIAQHACIAAVAFITSV